MSLSYTQRRLVESKHAGYGMMTSVVQLQTFLSGFGRVFGISELLAILEEEDVAVGEVIPVRVCLNAVRQHRPRSLRRVDEMEAFVAYGGQQDGTGEAEDPSDVARAVPLQAFRERFRERLSGGVGIAQPSLYSDLTPGTPRAGEELARGKGGKQHAKRIRHLRPNITRTASAETSDTASTLSRAASVVGLVREEADDCVDRHQERLGWMQGAIGELLAFKSVQRPVALELDGRMRRGLRRPTSALAGNRSLVPSLVEREAMKLDKQIAILRSEQSTTSTSSTSRSTANKRVFTLPNADQLVRRVARASQGKSGRPQSASAVRAPAAKTHRMSILAPHLRKSVEYVGLVGSADELRSVVLKVISPLPIGHVVKECYIVCGQDGDVRVSADTFRLLPSLCDIRVATGIPESSAQHE